MPALSVIIPTRDRPETLSMTLAALAAQNPVPEGTEILVVENVVRGAAAEIVATLDTTRGAEVSVLFEPRPGPAAARNRGIEAARGHLLLLLGDDTAPVDADFLNGHLRAHATLGSRSAVLGLIRFPPDATPFMRWLDDGLQFDFPSLSPGPVAIDRHFYSSNVSLPAALAREAGGFDVTFSTAAVEDLELGWRLARLGAELVFHPELAVEHDHPTSYADSLRRMARIGEAAAQLHTIQPDCDVLTVRGGAYKRPLLDAAGRLLLRRRALAFLPASLRRRRWTIVHLDAFHRAYHGAGRAH